MIDIDLVPATTDHTAVMAAVEELGINARPEIVDTEFMTQDLDEPGWGDPEFVLPLGFLLDNSVREVTDPAAYERELAELLAARLGVRVASARDYDAGLVPPAEPAKGHSRGDEGRRHR